MLNVVFIAFIPFDNIFSKFWTKNKPVQKLFIFFFLNVKDVLNHSNKLGIDFNECSFFHNEISMFLSNCFQKNLNEPYCFLREVHEFLLGSMYSIPFYPITYFLMNPRITYIFPIKSVFQHTILKRH